MGWVQEFYIFNVQLEHLSNKIRTAIELYGPELLKNLIRSDFAADSDLPVCRVPM